MTALPLIQPETASGETADLLAVTQQMLGITPNLARALANSPAALRGFLGLVGALRGGSLPWAVREQIALLVAQETGCDYSLSAHSYTATRVAASRSDADRARKGEASEPQAAAALAFAAALLRRQGRVTNAELAAARAAGLTDRHLAELVAHVALGLFSSYFAKAARVQIDWPLVRHTS